MAQEHSTGAIPEDRPLSADERLLLRWMLEHGETHAPAFLSQLADARVVGRCPCGCASIDFSVGGKVPPAEGTMDILSDYIWRDAERHQFGAFVFARGGLLAGLDLYSVDGTLTPTWLPKPEELIALPLAKREV
jgi:hypothetical protein